MSIESESIREAKAALKQMSSSKTSKLTRQQFVTSLIKEIHAKMEAGFQLAEICEELNKALPENRKIKPATFRAYVRTARAEAGIKPLKAWTRRSKKDQPKAENKANAKDEIEAKEKNSTSAGFREMGEL